MKKNQSTRRKKKSDNMYGTAGLWLAGISVIVLFGALIMKGLEAAQRYTPTDLTLLPRLLWVGGGGILIGLAMYAMSDLDRVRMFFSGRQAKYGSNSLLAAIAFIIIIVLANKLAYDNPQEWDWTKDKQNTLAPETINVLSKLPEPVTATAFFSSRYSNDSARELLDKFKNNSKGRFDYKFVDPDKNPVAAKNAGITGDGKILLQMGKNHEIVATATENELTSGFIRLLNPEKFTIYFLSGEGEHSTDEAGDKSYTRIREVLEGRNYVVKSLNLEAQKIPADAKVIVIAGATAPLSDQAEKALEDYLASGGSLIVLRDSDVSASFGDKEDKLATYLTASWGITLNNDVIVDTQSPTGAFNATAVRYTRHPITEKMGGIGVTLPYARSLSTSTGIEGVTTTELIYTTDAAWGETDLASIEANQPANDPKTEKVESKLLAATAENSATKGRVIVVGNSAFATDANFDYSGNGDFLVNSIDWSAKKESLINLTMPDSTIRSFSPPQSPLWLNLMLVSAVCLIPLVIIVLGVVSWYRRRKKG